MDIILLKLMRFTVGEEKLKDFMEMLFILTNAISLFSGQSKVVIGEFHNIKLLILKMGLILVRLLCSINMDLMRRLSIFNYFKWGALRSIVTILELFPK